MVIRRHNKPYQGSKLSSGRGSQKRHALRAGGTPGACAPPVGAFGIKSPNDATVLTLISRPWRRLVTDYSMKIVDRRVPKSILFGTDLQRV
jgi:hypothetical protein